MTAKELKGIINEFYKSHYKPLGFIKLDGSFLFETKDATFSLLITALNYDNCFPLSFSSSSGLKEVSELYLKAQGKTNNIMKINDQVFTNQSVLLMNGEFNKKHFDVFNELDAEIALKEIYQYFITNLVIKLKEIVVLKNLDYHFNIKELIPSKKRLINDICYGLITAKLNHNPNYKEIKTKYLTQINHLNEFDKSKVKKIADYLDDMP